MMNRKQIFLVLGLCISGLILVIFYYSYSYGLSEIESSKRMRTTCQINHLATKYLDHFEEEGNYAFDVESEPSRVALATIFVGCGMQNVTVENVLSDPWGDSLLIEELPGNKLRISSDNYKAAGLILDNGEVSRDH